MSSCSDFGACISIMELGYSPYKSCSCVNVQACKIVLSPVMVVANGIYRNGGPRFLTRKSSATSGSDLQLKQPLRRSANYHPSIWKPEHIQSFTSDYTYELYAGKLEELKQEVKKLFASTKGTIYEKMELIDSVQRLGVAYHFEEEIKEAINGLLLATDITMNGYDLNATALHFRLLRQHGYPITTNVFDKFRNKNDGGFDESLREDVAGLLNLYEASFLGSSLDEDFVLQEAKSFCTKHLNKYLLGELGCNSNNPATEDQVRQSLELPLHWRMPRIEAQNFIRLYSKTTNKQNFSLVLLQLAALDYNLVQSLHQKEVKELARWWRDLGFKETLRFSRDRLMENYLWAMGIVYEPQFSNCRIGLTKFVCILTAIDDMYDVYGSLDELELLTEAVKRWDIGAMETLPDYMQILYLTMINFGNGLAYDVLKIHSLNSLSNIKKEWANLCESYLEEARWYSSGYKPPLDQYLANALTSVGGPAAIVHAYLQHLQDQGCSSNLTKSSLNALKDGHEIIYWSSLITRLSNDLGTSVAENMRGDVAKTVELCMIEEGISEEEARDRIKGLVNHSWKKLNESIY